MKIMNIIFPITILIMGYTHLVFANQQFNITNSRSKTSDNLSVVQGFFQSFIDGTFEQYINEHFDPEVRYVVVGTESNILGTEREAILTHSGLYEGPDGANYFFDIADTERSVLSFNVHETFVKGDSAASFGSFRFISDEATGGSGDILETEWATRITLRKKKFFTYEFFEDTYAVACGYRHKLDGIKWRRGHNGNTSDIITGTKGNDVIDQSLSSNENFIFGYKGDDTITGGPSVDTLYGGEGVNTLTGNNGADIFAIGKDQGTNTINDFIQGQDKIALTLGLTFEKLTFTDNGDDLEIAISSPSTHLAVLKNSAELVLTTRDFITLPEPPQVTDIGGGFVIKADPFGEPPSNPGTKKGANVKVVKKFFKAFTEDGSHPEELVSDDVRFTVVGTESDLFGAERDAVLPYTGLYTGKQGVKDFFNILKSERAVVDFNVEEIYSSGYSAAAFGTYAYSSPLNNGGSGKVFSSDWAARIWLVKNDKGKPLIYRYHFYEDTAVVAAGHRHNFSDSPVVDWTREFGGLVQNYHTGTSGIDNIEGKDSPVNLRNRIFGYEGQDILTGKAGNDFLYGGSDNDTLNGGNGHDDLYGGDGDDVMAGGDGDDNLYGNEDNDTMTGNDGADIFVLGQCDGTDIITDYVDGQDKIGLLGKLTFKKLKLIQKGDDVEIRAPKKYGGVLATLKTVSVSNITEDDFTSRSDSGAVINPRRDLLGFPEFGFGPNYPIFDHPLIDLKTGVDDKCNK